MHESDLAAPFERKENDMKKITATLALMAVLSAASPALALDDETLEAAVGGGLGGAVGAAVGNEVAGETGAILGGALGAAGGAALAVEEDDHDDHRGRDHCPPGHDKKGWC